MDSVTIEGVSFNIALCSQMTLPEFKKQHKAFWKDKAERETILEKSYGIIIKESGKFQ